MHGLDSPEEDLQLFGILSFSFHYESFNQIPLHTYSPPFTFVFILANVLGSSNTSILVISLDNPFLAGIPISKSPTFQARKLNVNLNFDDINGNNNNNITNTISTYGKYLNLPDNNNTNRQRNSLLKFCGNKKSLTYYELQEQFSHNVLADELSLNDNLLGKFFRKDLDITE